MSEPENSNNLRFPPPSSPSAYTRHSRFYHSDGSTVFLAGNKLFKFPVSLLAADADIENYEFKDIMRDAIDGLRGDTSKPGANDAHPIVLPADVTSDTFEDLLMVVFGGVTNSALLSFLESLRTSADYSPLLVTRLVRLDHLGNRFGMKGLSDWVQPQIRAILGYLVTEGTHGVSYDWSAESILQLVRCTQILPRVGSVDHRDATLGFTLHIISALVTKIFATNEIFKGHVIDACAVLYKEKTTLASNPWFFGFIFATMVSLGHHSPIWTDQLTREDRRILYAANTVLTCLSSHTDLEVNWVSDPSMIKKTCSECSEHFNSSWLDAFSSCKGLTSRLPLEDIRRVVALPEYRMKFLLLMNSKSTCKCAFDVSRGIGRYMMSLYCALAKKYEYLVETV